jgi:uncharacterized protein (TIGR03545 family)
LRKKAIASRGILRGLRFNTPRDTSGELLGTCAGENHVQWTRLGDQAAALAGDWLDGVGRRFQQDLVAELESVRLAEELVKTWPQKYAALERDVDALKGQAEELRDRAQLAQTNPLRNAEFLESLPQQIKTLEESVRNLHQTLESLPGALQEDHRRILAARAHDEQLLREKLKIDEIDSAAMTAYFLKDHVAVPLAEVIGWVRWARALISAEGDELQPERQRGTDVQFAGCRPLPDFLIRSLQLQGTARIAGQPVELNGTLTDATNDPAVHGRPMKLVVTTSGSLPLELQATIDRTGDAPRDELLVDCHGILLPQISMGSPDTIALSLSPSTASVNLSLLLDGDQLTGDIQLIQKSVQITPTVASTLVSPELDAVVNESLRKLNSLATRISLSGTLDAPELHMWSSLGPAMAEAMARALEDAVTAKTDELLAESQVRIDENLAGLESLIAKRQAELNTQLDVPREQLKQLVAGFVGEHGLSLEQLGRRLPVNSLFRR